MTTDQAAKVWFITGASRGFGRIWTEAALERGDRVVATARDTRSLADLAERHPQQVLTLELDVTERAAVFAAVGAATERFGRIDVVVGNAGFGLFGAVEEVAEADARRQIEVNVFGALWLLQAVAPVLRSQRAGRVLLTSSFGTAGLYGASKYALEALGDSYAQEMRDFDVHVTLIEPASYATDFAGSSASEAQQLPPYDAARQRTGRVFGAMPPGDPAHTAASVLALADQDEPPLRMLLGAHVLPLVLDEYRARIASWEDHREEAERAQ